MPDGGKPQNPLNPFEFWRLWNEATTNIWANAMNNGNVAGTDSSEQRGVMNSAQALLDPCEAWKLWLDTTMKVWGNAIGMGGDPFGVIAGWVKVIEKVQDRAYSGEPFSFDLSKLFHEWYEATSKPWSSMVEDLIGSERFLAFADPFLESYSNLISTFRDASEAYFKALRLPTHSDIARVAELIVDLEEKVDNIEDAIERGKEQATPGAAPMARAADMEQRLNHIETKLDRMLALLEKGKAVPAGDFRAIPDMSAEERGKNEDQQDVQ